jgi:signal transduction histidine kinase
VAAAASAVPSGRVSTLAAPVAALACAGLAFVLVLVAGTPETTYAGSSAVARTVDVAAAAALLGAAVLAALEPRTRRLAVLAAAIAVAWLGPHLEGWDGGPPVVRSFGAVVAPFLLPLVVHLVLAAPLGRLPSRVARLTVGAGYALATVVVLGRASFADPSLDTYCWRNCSDNVFLVLTDEGLVQALDDVWLRAAVALGVVAAAVAAWRVATATSSARRGLAPVLVPAALVGVAGAAYAVALLAMPLEDPRDARFAGLFVARALGLVALAVGMAWTVVRTRRARSAVARLAGDLAGSPAAGRLQQALADGLGDPALEVAYWLPRSRRYVDADGNAVDEPTSAPVRATTTIVRHGEPIAVVGHDRGLVSGSALERELGPAARLAIENERLQAEVLAQLHDLRASRTRVVETGDAERRRLERDLHDGAQQRLLAVSYELRLARARADGDLVPALDAAVAEARSALAELRELAHGIFPAILPEAGLAVALETLADGAPLPLELGSLPDERFPAAVEVAVYVAAAEAVDDAARRGATFVSIDVLSEGTSLLLTATDDGVGERAVMHVADRVGALDGSVEVEAHGLRVTIPCA